MTMLGPGKRLIGFNLVSIAALTGTSAHPRIFKAAILANRVVESPPHPFFPETFLGGMMILTKMRGALKQMSRSLRIRPAGFRRLRSRHGHN